MVSVLSLVACRPNTAAYENAFQQQAATIDQRYETLRAEEEDRWDALLKQVDGQRQYLVAVKPDSNYSPVERADAQLADFRKLCTEQLADADAETGEIAAKLHEVAKQCVRRMYRDAYIPALTKRFFMADASWAVATWLDSKDADIESIFAFSHNVHELAEINSLRRTIMQSKQRSLAGLAFLQQQELATASSERDEGIALERQRYRQKMLALSDALGAMGQSMSQPPSTTTTAAPTYQPYQAQPPFPDNSAAGCTSDYNCSAGSQCVKQFGSTTGVCAKAVNAYGNQSFAGPRPGSVMPKIHESTDCHGLQDCPVGFACEFQTGVCRR